MKQHDGPHDGNNPYPDPTTDDGLCFGCKIQTVTLDGPTAAPTRSRDRKYVHRPIEQPHWEAGVAGEHRPDGSFMPYLDTSKPGLPEIGVKQFGEQRRELVANRTSQVSNPNHYG